MGLIAATAGVAPIGPDVPDGVGGLAQDVNLLWVCIGAALVMLMQAGFALVETGFTGKKNSAHTMGMKVAIFGPAFAAFFVVGYSLMYRGYSLPQLYGYDSAIGSGLVGSGTGAALEGPAVHVGRGLGGRGARLLLLLLGGVSDHDDELAGLDVAEMGMHGYNDENLTGFEHEYVPVVPASRRSRRRGDAGAARAAPPHRPKSRSGWRTLPVASKLVTGPMVEARALEKRFGSFVAVAGIDFEIAPGEAFGFLGPNGAGKTSTMRMVGCVSPRSGGDLRVLGLDPAQHGPEIRSRLGVVPQEDNLDTELTVWDNLMIYGRYFDLPRAEIRERAAELLEFVQLGDRRDSRVDPLSGGMKRRLTIARALLNRPEMMLLDEPTTGLDPQARHLLWDRLYQLKRSGVTLVLTTHYMDEAEQLCDRLVIMDNARIVAEGSPRRLISDNVTREVVELRLTIDADVAYEASRLKPYGERIEALADRVLVYTDEGDAVANAVSNDGFAAESVLVRRASLEDVFLILTGRSLED